MKIYHISGRVSHCLIIFFALLFAAAPAFCLEQPAGGSDKRVSFQFRDQPMAEVAGQISEQLNYKVRMDDELATVPVSGNFTNVSLDDFFSRRIFRDKNIAILFDDAERVVTISSLGKKGTMTEYDRTSYIGLDAGLEKIDPMDHEVQPGVKRRDVKPYVSDVDPMDQEVQPGVKRRDVEPYVSDVDPMDQEVQPGIKRRDVEQVATPVDPEEVEIQPGVRRVDVVQVAVETDPLDMEVQPGIKRRDVLQFNVQ